MSVRSGRGRRCGRRRRNCLRLLLLAEPDALDHCEEARDEEHPHRRRHQHPPEHRGPHAVLRRGAGAAGQYQRDNAMINANAVIRMGRSRSLAASSAASYRAASLVLCLRELHDQRFLAARPTSMIRPTWTNTLLSYPATHTLQERPQRHQRRFEQHRPGQLPARTAPPGAGTRRRWPGRTWARRAAPASPGRKSRSRQTPFSRQYPGRGFLERRHRFPDVSPGPGHAGDLHGSEEIEPDGDLGAGGRRHTVISVDSGTISLVVRLLT